MTRQPPTIIALDQVSVGKTGIVVGTYTANGKVNVLKYEVIKGLDELHDWFTWAVDVYDPFAIIWEGGYWDKKKPAAGISVWKAGGRVEFAAKHFFPNALRRNFTAVVWRAGLFPGSGTKDRAAWKKYVLLWARQIIPELKDGDDDIADALAIFCWGGEMLAKEGKITFLDEIR